MAFKTTIIEHSFREKKSVKIKRKELKENSWRGGDGAGKGAQKVAMR